MTAIKADALHKKARLAAGFAFDLEPYIGQIILLARA
jgi:hypothetical protein